MNLFSLKLIAIGLLLVFCASIHGFDGTAISVSSRYTLAYSENGDKGSVPEMPFIAHSAYTGKIVKYSIEKGVVTKTDTIYDRTLARYPTFNIDGNLVAFFLFDARVEGNSLINEDGDVHLAVMDSKGNYVRKLVTMPFSSFGEYRQGVLKIDNRKFTTIDWPAGPWIYYHKFKNTDSNKHEIWKVKYNDPFSDQHVFTYNSIRNWDLSLDGKKSTIRSNECTFKHKGFCNIPHEFPPIAHPTPAYLSEDCIGGCNPIISSSGSFYGHFRDGVHKYIWVHPWTPGQDCGLTPQIKIYVSDMANWAKVPEIEMGRGMDWPRWSANSDKWYCCNVGMDRNTYRTGSNQVIVNWVDSQAVQTTRSDLAPNLVTKLTPPERHRINEINSAGDFWLAGGPRGHYQDITGNWIPMGEHDYQLNTAKPPVFNKGHVAYDIIKKGNSIIISFNHSKPQSITLRTFNGASLLYDRQVKQRVAIPLTRFAPGLYVLSIEGDAGNISNTIVHW